MVSKKRFLRLATACSVVWIFACAVFLSFKLGSIDAGPGTHIYSTSAPQCLASCEVTNLGFPFRKYEDHTSGAIFAVTHAKFFDRPTVIRVDAVGIVSLLVYPVLGVFLLGFLYFWMAAGRDKAAK